MTLPNHKISVVELENIRRQHCQSMGIRYTKLAPRQALMRVIEHNQRFIKESV